MAIREIQPPVRVRDVDPALLKQAEEYAGALLDNPRTWQTDGSTFRKDGKTAAEDVAGNAAQRLRTILGTFEGIESHKVRSRVWAVGDGEYTFALLFDPDRQPTKRPHKQNNK